MRCTLLLPLVLLLLPAHTHAQVRPDTTDASAIIEAALEEAEDEAEASAELVEWLTERIRHPLNLNRATTVELARLPGLSALLARRIVRHREEQGAYTSLPELRAVSGLDAATYRAIRPFLTLETDPDDESGASTGWTALSQHLEGRFIQRLTRRLDVGRGYDDDTSRTTYAGSPSRLYTRLHLTTRQQVSLNLTLEKDPGEAFRWEPRTSTYGFDHVTAHAALRDVGRFETLVIGDFSAAFGQGVALSRSFTLTKGRDVVTPVARQGQGLTPYSSTDENHFFRGLGTTVRLPSPLTLSLFGSRRSLDATLASDTTVTRFATSGLHRTLRELEQKDAVQETLLGGAIEARSSRGQIGVVGYRSVLSHPIAPPAEPYRRFDVTGSAFSVVSTYAHAIAGRTSFFGELTRSASSAWGGIGGMQIDASHASAVVAVRHYPSDFASRHGRAFGTQSGPPRNETGTYLGLSLRPARAWRLSGYIDQYRFPWLRFAAPRPSAGYDARLVVEHAPRSWLRYYLQLRTETREDGVSIPAAASALLDGVQPTTRQSARLHGEYTFSSQLRLQARIEFTRALDPATSHSGLLLYQGLRWQARPGLRLDGRWTLFDTAGFPARIYAYEHDLLYTFSVSMLSGRGARQYLLMAFTPLDRLHLEVKYGITRYRNVTSVGSGLDEVPGSRVREVRTQVRWQF